MWFNFPGNPSFRLGEKSIFIFPKNFRFGSDSPVLFFFTARVGSDSPVIKKNYRPSWFGGKKNSWKMVELGVNSNRELYPLVRPFG